MSMPKETPTGPTPLPCGTKGFRLRAKQLFLTYPQCSLGPEEALEMLKAKLPLREWIIARENHKDGSLHLHCFLSLQTRCDVKKTSDLDLGDYHGNYQAARSRKAVMKYVQKGGQFITNMTEKDLFPEDPYQEARSQALAGNVDTAISILAESKRGARDLVLHEETIVKNLRSIRPSVVEVRHQLNSFNWNVQWDQALTLILWGPTNTGKTALAKALIPNALLIRHLDRLRTLKTGTHGGIILDDMSFSHLPREAQIHLLDTDEDTDIHVRYSVATIPRGTLRIITTNLTPGAILNLNDEAIRRRVQCIRVEGIGNYVECAY